MSRTRLSRDAHLVLGAQAARAFAYGLGAVLVGATLERRRFSTIEVSGVLAAIVAGATFSSLAVGRYGDRLGRRRCYAALYAALAATGVIFAISGALWLLLLVALTGALSTDVVESGPFTSLEQVMLASDLEADRRLRGFGAYNAIATAAGSLGALAAGLPWLLAKVWHGAPSPERYFLLFVPVAAAGAVLASRLSPAVERVLPEASPTDRRPSSRLGASRGVITRLSGLFALDSLGGGFVVQAFVAYWLTRRFGASTATIGVVFFSLGLLQTASFLASSRLAERFGMLATMVFSHLPSNLLLIAVGFSPNIWVAVVLLLARTSLSQMDVPVRQAYVMALVEPGERTAAAVYTNSARYVARPAGTALAGVVGTAALGAPFLVGGVLKSIYDIALWTWFRRVPLPTEVPM